MPDPARKILICSCEDTMPLDEDTIRRGCSGADIHVARQLCRSQVERFRGVLATGDALTVACAQEAPLFADIAAEQGAAQRVAFVNIRETAGWSSEATRAGPKMAAMLATAAEPSPDAGFVRLESGGRILIYGSDERALEVADLLKDRLDVTVMIKPPAQIAPPRATDYAVLKGIIRGAQGWLGQFELTIDESARALPSSRAAFSFGPSRNGLKWHCDILFDVTSDRPLFTAADLREGYLRANPSDPAGVFKAALKARDLIGEFDKPRYIAFSPELCAHSRSGVVGCTRCLDLCPTGAITPAGDQVAIDPYICAGCGQCAVACPTGAAAYALPPTDALMRQVRTLLTTYRETGGKRPILLVHENAHGGALIDALSRFGDGLPANVLPLAVNEVTQVGLETIAAAFAYGALAVRFIERARPRHDSVGLARTMTTADAILTGLGFGRGRVATIQTDDPEILAKELRLVPAPPPAPRTASFLPMGDKRGLLRFALRELHDVAPKPVAVVPLPPGAPLGRIDVDAAGCTLCLACVSACPTGALGDDPDRPLLRFAEDACVQCGLCEATCPEKVITLTPQLDFAAATTPARILKEEEPFCCIRCGKAFGVKSTIARITAKLQDAHWMFSGTSNHINLIKMCEDCRVITISQEEFDPHAKPRPPMRTTEDYVK